MISAFNTNLHNHLNIDYDYIENEIIKLIRDKWENYYAVIKVEKSYI